MMKKSSEFLSLVKSPQTNDLRYEESLLNGLRIYNKSFVVVCISNRDFVNFIDKLSSLVETQIRANIIEYRLNSDGNITQSIVGAANQSKNDFVNTILKASQENPENYYFLCSGEFYQIVKNSEILSNISEVFARMRKARTVSDSLYEIKDLPLVFDFLDKECRSKIQDGFFEDDGYISAEVKEKRLRNFLHRYLEGKMKGIIQQEHCTTTSNDEESVDLFLVDDKENAIIEVKFSFIKKHYHGATKYSIVARTKDGLNQMDKYCKHLEIEGVSATYGYIYMFYSNEHPRDVVKRHLNEIADSKREQYSSSFKSTFTNVDCSNLYFWLKKQ